MRLLRDWHSCLVHTARLLPLISDRGRQFASNLLAALGPFVRYAGDGDLTTCCGRPVSVGK